jgi:hypothetical protein
MSHTELFEDQCRAEEAAWQDFVRRLGDHLSGQWPALLERMHARYAAFIGAAVEQAEGRGLNDGAAVARWVNLCVVWGAGFDEKPGFGWAADILLANVGRDWQATHQLVRRSALELARLASAHMTPQALLASDQRLVEAFADVGRRGSLLRAVAAPTERALVACDLEALELRLAEQPERAAYRLEAGVWSRQPEAVAAPLRVDLAHALPARLYMLSPPQGAPARLRLRGQLHGGCGAHPLFRCMGPLTASTGSGPDLGAIELELAPQPQPVPAAWGPASRVAEETPAEFYQLDWQTCGLRDAGPVLGAQRTLMEVRSASRWWTEIQRSPPNLQGLLGTVGGDGRASPKPWQRGGTRTRTECDGRPQDAGGLSAAFESSLDGASGAALEQLARAWSVAPAVHSPTLEVVWGQLLGRAELAWGWRTAALDSAPSMQLLGLLEMQAAHIDLALRGNLSWGGASARLELRCLGEAPLACEMQLDGVAPALGEHVVALASVAWRFAFEAQLMPLAEPSGALLQINGPLSGALTGAAGLRPNTHGGSGFEWFAQVRLERVSLPVMALDPVTGSRSGRVELLPDQVLLHWSLGDG